MLRPARVSRSLRTLIIAAASSLFVVTANAAEIDEKAAKPARAPRSFSAEEVGQLFTKLERPERKPEPGFVTVFDVDEDVVQLETFIITGERLSLSEKLRQQIERPRLVNLELIKGARKTLGADSMMRLPLGIALASEPTVGGPRDAPGGSIPIGLIFATPTISRDLAGWFENHFLK